MKVKTSFIIIFILIQATSFGQFFKNDSIINVFANNLTANQIDTILIYEAGCHCGWDMFGVMEKNDSCFCVGEPQISYAFWKKNDFSYVNKISNCTCYVYDTILYDFELVWDLFFNNKLKIKNEEILSPMYIEKGDTLWLEIDHYSYSQVMVINNNEKTDFGINEFYFLEKIDKERINLNYKNNSKTLRRKLQILIDNELKIIKDNKLIKEVKNSL